MSVRFQFYIAEVNNKNNDDIRWKQRLSSFEKAFALLTDAVSLSKSRKLSVLEEQGLIQGFEFTHELAWNLLKDYFAYQGNTTITGSRDAVREAFNIGLIHNGEGWMEMIKSRNRSSHTYDESVAKEIHERIVNTYHELFEELRVKMRKLASE